MSLALYDVYSHGIGELSIVNQLRQEKSRDKLTLTDNINENAHHTRTHHVTNHAMGIDAHSVLGLMTL